MKPLCFVLIPLGNKTDLSGKTIDFDALYNDFMVPAIKDAGLKPLRADEEMTGDIIHKPMSERFILCEYAVVDLTTAGANVFYELGIRHALRNWSTVLVYSEGGGRLPFDVSSLRALPYKLTGDGKPTDIASIKVALRSRLNEAKEAKGGSSLYQLVEDFPDIDHTKTDVFRDRAKYSQQLKERLAEARKDGLDALKAIEVYLGTIGNIESGVVLDLFLSYRAVKGWREMIDLAGRMAPPLAATVMVREQLALALNRKGERDKAESILLRLIERRDPGSETYGILGRIYKDRHEEAMKKGENSAAKAFLDRAIDFYLKGYDADMRDAYPGINAATMMELQEPPDPRREALIPAVTYAVQLKIKSGKPDYWDYASLLELAVLANHKQSAIDALGNVLTSVREIWEPETTARNLRLIQEARKARGDDVDWTSEIIEELKRKAESMEDLH